MRRLRRGRRLSELSRSKDSSMNPNPFSDQNPYESPIMAEVAATASPPQYSLWRDYLRTLLTITLIACGIVMLWLPGWLGDFSLAEVLRFVAWAWVIAFGLFSLLALLKLASH